MWAVTATATDTGPAITAHTDSAYLKGIRWVWHGGRLVDYSLDASAPVDAISVPYEWETGTVGLAFSVEAFREWIASYYLDQVNIRTAREAIAKG